MIEGGAIGDVPEDVQELVSIAKRNCDRLIRLINDILDAKKIEAGKLQVRKMPLRADELVWNAVEVMQPIATEARVELRAEPLGAPRFGSNYRATSCSRDVYALYYVGLSATWKSL